jgi:hypothetical protein
MPTAKSGLKADRRPGGISHQEIFIQTILIPKSTCLMCDHFVTTF